MNGDFLTRYRSAVAPPGTDPALVFLGNFEVENRWAVGENGLPRQFSSGQAVANRMDELTLLLAGPHDRVLLKEAPDPDYLDYLKRLGVDLPTVLVATGDDPLRSISEDALADPELCDTLSSLSGAVLAPHGISDLEEQLSVRTGLPLGGPSAAVCKAVNSKVYSRRLADRLGLRQPSGRACSTVDELTDAIAWGTTVLAAGRSVVVKDAYGVSGKGIVVVTPDQGASRLARLGSLVTRRLPYGDERLGIVIEEWVDKTTDLSCQLTVRRGGGNHLDWVKEAVIAAGVPQGHRIPATLSCSQQSELEAAATAIAAALADDGWFGVVGIDAMTEPSGGVWPMVEINARHNLSTYQATLQEQFMTPEQTALGKVYPLRLDAPLPFAELEQRLGSELYDRATGVGLLVNNFATVNAGRARLSAAASFTGRLYGLVVAESFDHADALDRAVAARLADLVSTQD